MLKRISVVLGLLSGSAIAFAGMPGNLMPAPSGVVLTAPDNVSAWSFGIEALYLEPTGGSFQYTQVDGGSKATNQAVDPGFSWAGEADITYHFAGSGRDVTLGYTHFDTDDSDTTTLGSGETFNQGIQFLTPLALDPDKAKGEVDNDYNAVDLTFGQDFLVGDRLLFHPFMGLRYADIDTEDKVTYSDIDNAADTGTGHIDSDFQGAGPRAGVDIRVLSGGGLTLLGTFGGSLLIGEQDGHASAQPSSAVGGTPLEWQNDSNTEIVPELDGRIAIDYTPHKFFPAGSMGFQLGYEVVHYFNVANLDNTDTMLVNSVSNLSDFSYQGPYFRLQLNIA